MKKILFSAIALAVSLAGYAQWKPAGDKIKTTWAEQIDPNNVLPEYPRPIMERKEWKNLNGLWEYAIRPTGTQQPADMDGQILVPFAVESSLSGVMKTLGKENELWYSREFTVPSSWKGKNILLHFGAVDWQADVWVNGVKMGQHRGGYTPFSFDITPVLAKGKNQITVKVWDPSDEGYQPRGKQVKHPDGIWYTPVSGIWQTVWMEPVSANHITRLKTTPDIDKKILTVEAHTATGNPSAVVSVVVSEGGKVVATGKAMQGQPVQLAIENARLWSPENPFLYDMKVTLTDNGKVIDEVNSYAAMRKYSIRQGADGITRLQLNNRNVFHFGTLVHPLRQIRRNRMAGYAEWRQRTGMAKQTIFQRSRNGPFRRIGSQLPPGMERNHRPAVFQSLCRGMGTLQRMLGTIQNSRYRSLDKCL